MSDSSSQPPAARTAPPAPHPSAQLADAIKRQNEREKQLSVMLGQGDVRALRLLNSSCSEDTFEQAVQESMELFSTSREEAERDVVKEFKLMGLDMAQFEK